MTFEDIGDGIGESAEALLNLLLFCRSLEDGLRGDGIPEDLLDPEGLFNFFETGSATSIVKGVDGGLVGFLLPDDFRFDWILEGEGLGERYCLAINPSGTSIVSGKVIAAFLLLFGSPES